MEKEAFSQRFGRVCRSSQVWLVVFFLLTWLGVAGLVVFLLQEHRLQAERKAEEFRRNVPGLDELRAAIAENERNYERQRKDIEMGAPRIHTFTPIDTDALRAKYPAAAAYLKAEGYWMSDHYAKSSAGKKAMEIIAAGGDYQKAIADMEAEWKAHCEQHLWD